MKKFVAFMAVLPAIAVMANAQQVGSVNTASVNPDGTRQELVEVSVDRFEFEGTWFSQTSSDVGFSVSRLFSGGPAAKEPIPGEEDLDIPDENVLGVRVDFLRRGYHSFTVRPLRPIPIEGVTRTVSVWVAGRNSNHELSLLIRDMRGRDHSLPMGTLNFQGWRQLTVSIPPQSMDGRSGVFQRSHRNLHQRMGIEVLGFRIDTDPLESYGSYYVYFDDMRAVTDLFVLGRDPDDMVDGW